jgi:hypothetical protein
MYIRSTEGAQGKRKNRMKLSLPPKLIGFLRFNPEGMLIMHFFAGFL